MTFALNTDSSSVCPLIKPMNSEYLEIGLEERKEEDWITIINMAQVAALPAEHCVLGFETDGIPDLDFFQRNAFVDRQQAITANKWRGDI